MIVAWHEHDRDAEEWFMGAIVGATSLATGFFVMGGIIVGIVGIMGIVLIRILRNQAAASEQGEQT